jgi:hypothetical protein
MSIISVAQRLNTARGARRRHALLSAAALALLLAGNAHADAFLNSIGGEGGGQFQEHCANNDLLIGFELRVGDDVDAIRPLCVPAYGSRHVGAAVFTTGSGLITNNADSSAPWGISQRLESGWHGGTGGGLTRILCPNDQPIVTGMFVAAEGVDTVIVNNIHLFCAEASPTRVDSEHPAAIFDAPAYRASSAVFGIGRGGSQPYRDNNTQRCPGGTVAVGVHGRSGKWLDAIGLICAAPYVDASRAPVKSIGRVNTGTSPPGPPMSLCERARNARARNSPAAPNLEAQCKAIESQAASKPPTPRPSATVYESAPIQASAQASNNRRRSDSYSISSESTTTLNRAHGTENLPRQEAQAAIDNDRQVSEAQLREQAKRNDARGTFHINRESRSHDPYVRNGLDNGNIDRGATAQELSQPEDSIRVEVRYPMAYGYRDAQSQSAFGGEGPDSCYAFHIDVIADRQDPEVHGLVGIEYGAKPMRNSNGMYICEYLISNLQHEALISVRVAMTGDRTSAGDAWLGGSQPRPGRQQRREILDDEQSVVLTADQPRASLSFEMIYAGPH